jgi:hypothetical protein
MIVPFAIAICLLSGFTSIESRVSSHGSRIYLVRQEQSDWLHYCSTQSRCVAGFGPSTLTYQQVAGSMIRRDFGSFIDSDSSLISACGYYSISCGLYVSSSSAIQYERLSACLQLDIRHRRHGYAGSDRISPSQNDIYIAGVGSRLHM